MANDRLSQLPVEVLEQPTSAKARTSELPVEALVFPADEKARFSQVLAEILFHREDPGEPTTYSEAVLFAEPWVWYRMGEPSGAVALDSSPNERHGSYNGGPTLNQSGGIAVPLDDGAVLFDAVNDYLRSPVVFNKPLATMIVFFDYSGTPPGGASCIAGLADGDGAGTTDKFFDIMPAGNVRFVAFDGGGKTAADPAALTAGWHMLAGRADGSTLDLLIDGVEVASVACGPTYASYTVPNVFVAGAQGGASRLAGKRDEFILYDYALTDDQILDIYTLSQVAQRPTAQAVVVA